MRLHVAPLYFIPLGDRHTEREHDYLSDIVRPKTRVVRGHWFSVRRLRPLEHRMFIDPLLANRPVEHFMSLERMKSAIKMFGLERHPLFQEALANKTRREEKPVHDMLRGFCEQVVYRQELGMKYTTCKVASKVNEAMYNRWRAAKKQSICETVCDSDDSGRAASDECQFFICKPQAQSRVISVCRIN